MRQPDEVIEIQSCDYWFKIVEFLQQNWALIDQTPLRRFGSTEEIARAEHDKQQERQRARIRPRPSVERECERRAGERGAHDEA